jgi:hypothetical protein
VNRDELLTLLQALPLPVLRRILRRVKRKARAERATRAGAKSKY